MNIILLVSVLFISSNSLAEFVITAHDSTNTAVDNEPRGLFGFDVADFLKKNGYPFENHEVTTEDGYILAVHRIPHGKDSESKDDAKVNPAVLFMHGTAGCSVDFFRLGPQRSLALFLADQGYDVWLGNNRGNTWSRKHQSLDPDNNKTYWDFSFHELGIYDTSSIIDHILDATGNKQISYIGHDQGTTQFFVLASEQPEYNDKINTMMALAPAVYCQNMSNPIVQIVKDFYSVLELATDYFNITEVLGHSTIIETALTLVCKDGSQFQEACPLVLFVIYGFDSDQFDRSILAQILEIFPAGLSIKELKHYLQLIKSGYFRKFDYGVLKNLKLYNQTAPPDYDLTKVTAPVSLYYAKNDWLVAMANVEQLADELPNLVEKYLVEYDFFNHLDFLYARDVSAMLYFDLINKLNDVNGLDAITSLPTVPTPTSTVPPATTTTNAGNTDSGNTTTTDPKVTTTTDTSTSENTTPGAAFSVNSVIQTTCIFMLMLVYVI